MQVKTVFKLLIITLIISGCGEIRKDKNFLPASTGKYGEVLVVVDTIYENGATGEALDEVFNKIQEGLPKAEPMFRMSTVPPAAFKSILKRGRNILQLSIGKGKSSNTKVEKDVWAKNQLLINITAANDAKAAEILTKNIQQIRAQYNAHEVDDLKAQFAKKPEKKLMQEVLEKHALSITIPPAFLKMKILENGIWLQKEKSIGEHQIIQGLLVYTEPYTSDSTFSKSYFLRSRNRFTESAVLGFRENSYMRVYQEYEPLVTELNLNGFYSMEYRGLWNMTNDFMGGPFLHYTIVNEDRNEVIHLDGFVFAPQFQKREYLRELEAMMKTIRLEN